MAFIDDFRSRFNKPPKSPPDTLEQMIKEGRACAKSRPAIKRLALGALSGVLIGLISESVSAMEVASNPDRNFVKALKHLESGNVIDAENALLGTWKNGALKDGFYDELLAKAGEKVALHAAKQISEAFAQSGRLQASLDQIMDECQKCDKTSAEK